MNKAEFVAAVSEKTGFTKKDVSEMVKAYQEVVIETVKRGDKISFPGYATIDVASRSERTGRNPSTGETITIPASKKPKAKFAKNLSF